MGCRHRLSYIPHTIEGRDGIIGFVEGNQASRAEARMADEIDAGQERGEVATPKDTLRKGPVVQAPDNGNAAMGFAFLSGVLRLRCSMK